MDDVWTISMEREQIEVTTSIPTLDPDWTYTDQAGHEHHAAPGYPTLRWVETYTPETPGAVYIDADGDEWNDDPEGYYECPLCGERITPGVRGPDLTRRYIPGPATVTITGQLDGDHVRLIPREDPSAFLDALRTADPADRDAIIEQYVHEHHDWCEITSVVTR